MIRTRRFFAVAAIFLASGCTPRPSYYSIVSQTSGKCISLNPFGGYYDGDPAEQWNCSHYHMGLQASWQFKPTGAQYQIRSIHSGKCLEVNLSSGGKSNGDIVQQSKCTTGDNQKWNVQLDATITSLYSGKCVEVKVGSTGALQDGDKIDQSDCTKAKNQLWTLQSITALNPPLDTGKGELCNVCDPTAPNCKPGALCLVTPMNQSICGQSCSTVSGCPAGYACTKITQLGVPHFQCAPVNNECPR